MKLAPKLLNRRLAILENKLGRILKNFGGSLEAWQKILAESVGKGELDQEDADMLFRAVTRWSKAGY